MNMTGNTILITGGGSGIGRALAEAFHKIGNKIIIAGRRQQLLDQVTAANPGMRSLVVDMLDKAAIETFASQLTGEFPSLNVIVHNAGIMRPEQLDKAPDFLKDAEEIVTTNLLGPIRLTAALLPALQKQAHSAILTVSSGLAFVPLAATPTYCATKAAIHSYSISIRDQLKGTSTQVIEIVPPYVQTELMGEHQAQDPAAMPLDAFISEVMALLSNNPEITEVIVERCKPLRFAAEDGSFEAVYQGLNKHPA